MADRSARADLETAFALRSPPKGYRIIPAQEFARRYRRCARSDRWADLNRVSLYDRSLGHLPISSIPYMWRAYVEPTPPEAKPSEGKP